MTPEELQKIPFKFQYHLAMEDEHTVGYISEDGRLGFCDHTLKKKDGTFGRSYRHWMIDGKVYKTNESFFEALKDFKQNVVPIRKR